MLKEFPAHFYLFTHGSLPPSFCIILCAGLLIFILSPSLQLLHQFVISSTLLCCLLGEQYLQLANTALSSGLCLEPLLVFLNESVTCRINQAMMYVI